ncbi:MAG: hypothetical protein JO356_01095 [Acidobacteria bacterium]|nr:hypothetical protein [Acidobacteriota bacterium]
MTRTEILELANQLSERKGEKVLSLPNLYRLVLQDICKRQRFWWRRLVFSFQTVVAQPTYDLTSVVTTPAGAMTEILLEEITKFSLIIPTNPFQTAEMLPMYDPETLLEMIQNTTITSPTQGNVNAPGGRYTLDPSGINVIRMDPPDAAYTAYVVGWAIPNPATDSTNDAVPLIPAWGHNTIVSGLVWKIFKWAYGSTNQKTEDAKEEYEQGILDLMAKRQFDPNYKLQLAMSEDAVRST